MRSGEATEAPWLAACEDFAASRGLAPRWLLLLAAFDTPGHHTGPRDFAALERDVTENTQALSERIAHTLTGEVDAAQARMFARRFQSVAERLRTLSAHAEEARLLAVGLHQRTLGAIEGPAPRALRVRAIADFYYSRAGVLHHTLQRAAHGLTALALPALVDGAVWAEVAPGVAHSRLAGQLADGPAHVNVLRVNPGAARLRCVDSRGAPDFAAYVGAQGAVAGVSGGFFLYSEPDILPPSAREDPVGLLVSDGRVLSPPALRRAALVVPGGATQPAIAVIEPTHLVIAGQPITLAGVNQPGLSGPTAYNRAFDTHSPPQPGYAAAIVGDRVVAAGAAPLAIPLAGVVVQQLQQPAAAGQAVVWSAALGDAPLDQGIAGGPILVRGGQPAFADLSLALAREDFKGTAPPRTFSGDETGDQNLLPRMAAGLTGDGALLFAAVDGRNFHRALGMTLGGLARLMVALGCQTALNLDGGSSKRMVVAGRTVDLPSTEVVDSGASGQGARVRPVHTAVLVHTDRS